MWKENYTFNQKPLTNENLKSVLRIYPHQICVAFS